MSPPLSIAYENIKWQPEYYFYPFAEYQHPSMNSQDKAAILSAFFYRCIIC